MMYVKLCINSLQKKGQEDKEMACFLVPAGEAVVTQVVKRVVEKKVSVE